MKKLILAAAMLASFGASADTSYNAALTSDYRYRGISQTRLQPALQGGVDYVDSHSGLYAGAWASTIKWTRDAGGSGSVELDIYGGKRGQLATEISYDVGVLTYVYADNGLKRVPGFANADTTEVYAQLGYGPTTLKYSHAVTNLFGFVDSKNSGYLDLSANLDAGSGYTINLHAGRQKVRNSSASDYTDWKVGVTKDFGVASVQLAAIGTNASKAAYASPANGKFTGRNAMQLTLSKTF